MIHHYTSVETLALILKYGKIRFNRLDLVDDVSELEGIAQFFSTHIFVSCWTEEAEESIPLWKMYTPNMAGVKISFPKNLFKRKFVPAFNEANYGSNQDYWGPLSKEETFTDNYIIMNLFDKPNSFYKKIVYRNDYPEIYKSFFVADEKGYHVKNTFDLGLYKKTQWEFQQESRFTLLAHPLLPLDHPLVNHSKFKQMELVNYCMSYGIGNSVEYIDVEIDSDKLQNIIVTTGPLCSHSNEIIVESLLKIYAPNGTAKRSALKGIIRK
ncbi:DUF2971 family protein [Arcticibacter tournemirensis]|uniref:DUF2971 domain-containing protein n=1 Tax=Arcticibacter tournemirensis TaxID=699437 RepID=A0A5M9GME7_9SPHI|nr:DUF2971 domain-containing protein [Arcticibacter tournemirensis]KAA8474941.1 DUF2971 domain-containing protein [Arcticibacter tournemirensis]TQM48522.1 DUF2971 family protein [Arcticibacter tournemirensis]